MIKKAWSLFWLTVASIIAISVLAAVIEPYLGVILLLFVVGVAATVIYKVWRIFRSGKGKY